MPALGITAIEDVATIAGKLGMELMLVGAGARILLVDERHGRSIRATKDFDFNVRVDDWEEFGMFRNELQASGHFTATRIPHRFVHASGILVDLVPFGGVEDHLGRMQFPGSGNVMNLLGTAEALLTSEWHVFGKARVRVVNEAGLALLKLFAWNDRRETRDLQDIKAVMDAYAVIPDQQSRIFSCLGAELETGAIDYDLAPACLLGLDVGQMAEQATRSEVIAILKTLVADDAAYLTPLTRRLGEAEDTSRQQAVLRQFQALLAGLNKADATGQTGRGC